MPPKKASKSAKARHARERQEEPINSASYAAVARRGLVATGPPASSTHAAEETREDYEGGPGVLERKEQSSSPTR